MRCLKFVKILFKKPLQSKLVRIKFTCDNRFKKLVHHSSSCFWLTDKNHFRLEYNRLLGELVLTKCEQQHGLSSLKMPFHAHLISSIKSHHHTCF